MAGVRLSVTVEGGDEVIAALKRLGRNVDAEVGAAVEEGGEVIRQEANRLAPGPHVVMEVEEGKGFASANIGPDEEHWYYRFFETGAGRHLITGTPLAFEGKRGMVVTGAVDHPGMAADPFLRPAFDGKQGEARDRVEARLKKAVNG